MAHLCDAIVISCIDFRFQKFIRDWLDKELKNKTFDYVGFAGATKDLKTIMEQIDISVRLHSIKEVYLIHHEDCGAYGKEGTPKRHSKDLKLAKNKILSKYQKMEVILYYLRMNGKFVEIK